MALSCCGGGAKQALERGGGLETKWRGPSSAVLFFVAILPRRVSCALPSLKKIYNQRRFIFLLRGMCARGFNIRVRPGQSDTTRSRQNKYRLAFVQGTKQFFFVKTIYHGSEEMSLLYFDDIC